MSEIQDEDDFSMTFKKKKSKNISNKRTTTALIIEQESQGEQPTVTGNITETTAPNKRIKTEQNVEFILPNRKYRQDTILKDILSVDESLNAQKNLQKLEDKSDDMIYKERSKSLYAPVSQNITVRSTTTIDYQPDICKDYKETGVCGWGDTCKFIHDRGDYSNQPLRTSWKNQMSAQSDKFKKPSYASTSTKSKDMTSSRIDYTNTKCSACLKHLITNSELHTNLQPVFLKTCLHTFCETCLLAALKKDTKCPICHVETHGLYFSLQDELAQLRKKPLSEKQSDPED